MTQFHRFLSNFKFHKLLLMVLGIALALAGARPAWAQRSTASINGTVKDASGGVVPQAAVTLTNTETNVTQTATTNDTGDYVILNILPGRYMLKAGKEGFETVTQPDFTLEVNQTTIFDFTLTVGSSKQTVTVEAVASHVETSTAELGTVVGRKMVNDLPLNGRNFTQLLELTPGVSPISVAQNAGGWTAQPLGSFTFPSVNGQTNRSNLFMLDGINNQGAFESTYAIAPQIDDIQEFKVQSHNDEAQFGGALGAIVNVVTKGGSNLFHGDGFEFLRNDAFDGRGFFVPPTQKITPYRQNQFGATLGGPVIIPHIYNGRDKTFFYASYEGFRNHTAQSSLYRVPTAAELSGDLSDFVDSSGKLIQMYNPFTTRPDPAHPGYSLVDPFPNNQIPKNLINPSMVRYANGLYPAPVNTGNPVFNGLDTTPNITRQDLASLRFDKQISTKDSAFIRYSGMTQPASFSGGFGGYRSNVYFHGYNFAGSWIHTFAGSAVAQFTIGRNSMQYNNPAQFTNVPAGFLQQVGFSPNFASAFIGHASLIPALGIPGFAGGGEGISNSHTSNVYEYKGDFSKLWGRHTIKAGADFSSDNFDSLYESSNVGFAATATSCTFCFSVAQGGPAGGVGLGSFLLNAPDSAGLRNVHETEHGGWIDGFYFQDQWKATDKLTFNMGLRYDVTLMPIYGNSKENTNTAGDVNFNNGTYVLQKMSPACSSTVGAPCIPGGTLPAHVVITPFKNNAIYSNVFDNWQPRLGIAYRLRPALVLHGAYGRFFDNWAAVTQTSQNFEGTWPQVGQLLATNLNKNMSPNVSALDPFSQGAGNAIPAPSPFLNTGFVQWYMNPLQKNPYSDQWNNGIDWQIGRNTVLTANYVGAHSSRLDLGGFYNVALTPGPGDAATVRSRQPYPYIPPTFYDRSNGVSSYNAFQFSLDKKSAGGLSYLISYTWSKNMSIGCDGWYGVEGCSIQDPYHPQNDRSVTGFDLTHILSFSWVYPMPIGKGRRWSTHSRAVDYAVGNWELNGIFFASSGAPYSIFTSGDIANTGCGCDRANIVAGAPQTVANQGPNQWLNPAAFVNPPPFTFGTMGRNAMRADYPRNFDLSLFREFPVTESKRFEFRAEFFNAFNTPLFSSPDNTVGDQYFGRIFSTSNSPRIIQFGLKFYF
ncbi:MAG TPA: TonB-dependent receptor [Terriglobia bacterium]|nr:TonB-dependent receptor [Terriglobia bacterium]